MVKRSLLRVLMNIKFSFVKSLVWFVRIGEGILLGFYLKKKKTIPPSVP